MNQFIIHIIVIVIYYNNDGISFYENIQDLSTLLKYESTITVKNLLPNLLKKKYKLRFFL